ncbi:MAG: hypothetical protein LBS75_04035 [Synergistaceae bacterium]|jgi:hypothetical protein|nr:hypothetical protein [Synergistaceae bacterium]
MGIEGASGVGDLVRSVARDISHKVRETERSSWERAMEEFRKAVRACDKASERMMDEHLESVAESAKRMAEYRARKARLDYALESAERQRLFNENIMIQRINHRNLLEERRVDELNRRELLKSEG